MLSDPISLLHSDVSRVGGSIVSIPDSTEEGYAAKARFVAPIEEITGRMPKG